MRLSKRGEYGLRALIDLAGELPPQANGHTVVQIKDIAERQQIPLKFLEQILLTLKNTGIVHSRQGIGGGYYLAKPANDIFIGQIVRALDGPLAPIRCASQTAYEPCDCPDIQTCGLRMVMLDVRNAIAEILDHTTLASVAARVDSARSQIHKRETNHE